FRHARLAERGSCCGGDKRRVASACRARKARPVKAQLASDVPRGLAETGAGGDLPADVAGIGKPAVLQSLQGLFGREDWPGLAWATRRAATLTGPLHMDGGSGGIARGGGRAKDLVADFLNDGAG